tara:strand:- start:2566 stop:4068 length:1503 start_codon:yes stop_codon:yes gene_type:complete
MKLFASCDYYHQRPLYYLFNNNKLYFSTNIDFILEGIENSMQIDQEIVYDYLVTGIPRKGRTIYKKINIVPNNYLLEFKNKKIKEIEMCRIDKFYFQRNSNNYSSKLNQIFSDTLSKQLDYSEDKVAFTLSGGLDSSSIVCTADLLNKNKKFYTHSWLYKGLKKNQLKRSNEKKFINLVNKKCDVTPCHHIFEKHGPLKIINETTNFSEPILGVNIFAPLSVFKRMKKSKINYLFEGTGGDSTISHGTPLFYELGKKFKLFKLIEQYKIYCDMKKKTYSLFECLKNYFFKPYLPFISLIRYRLNNNRNDFFNINIFLKDKNKISVENKIREILGYHQTVINFYKRSIKDYELMTAKDGIEAYANRCNYIAADKYDIETFDPFYNKFMKSFCINVPYRYKLYNGIDRYYFRESMKSIIPKEIYERKWKGDMSGIFFNELCSTSFHSIEQMVCENSSLIKKIISKKKLKAFYFNMKKQNSQKLGVILYKLIYMSIWLKKRGL